jgi:hypothetical protein
LDKKYEEEPVTSLSTNNKRRRQKAVEKGRDWLFPLPEGVNFGFGAAGAASTTETRLLAPERSLLAWERKKPKSSLRRKTALDKKYEEEPVTSLSTNNKSGEGSHGLLFVLLVQSSFPSQGALWLFPLPEGVNFGCSPFCSSKQAGKAGKAGFPASSERSGASSRVSV